MLLPRSGTIAYLPIARVEHHGHPASHFSLPQGFPSSPRCSRCREPRTSAATGRLHALWKTSPTAPPRSRLLGIVGEVLAELAFRPGHCAARNRHQVAPPGLQVILAMEVETREAWTPAYRTRTPRPDSAHVPGEPDLGRTTNPVGVDSTGPRCRRRNGGQVHGPQQETTLPNLANVSGQPCS